MPDATAEIVTPNLGVYLDRPAAAVPRGGCVDALNCRVRNGRILRENMGWKPFFDLNLADRVLLIDRFKWPANRFLRAPLKDYCPSLTR